MRLAIYRILRRIGWLTLTAADSDAAIARLKDHRPLIDWPPLNSWANTAACSLPHRDDEIRFPTIEHELESMPFH